MTTEVLRNMLYAESPAIDGLGYVVMDEVHYLADRFRGAVWEEVIIHLPQSVTLVSLSATVSNAEEFGDWLVTVRGHTTVVVSEVRPVPAVAAHAGRQPGLRPVRAAPGRARRRAGRHPAQQVHPRARRLGRRPRAGPLVREHERRIDPGTAAARGGSAAGTPHRPRYRPPARSDVIERLDNAGLLPRSRSSSAATAATPPSTSACSPACGYHHRGERAQIAEIIDRRTGSLPEEDLHVLGFWEWREGLLAGLAAHHAGLVPAFKETVEECFVRGLVKAVFATETLALGINMPARSVVLERLVKWNGEAHVDVTPGEYTQLTGRAGRRGIDVEGHAVVVWAPGVDPAAVAGLASTRTFPLRSSFRPSYNMAVNLVGSFGRARARSCWRRPSRSSRPTGRSSGWPRAAARHEREAERRRERDALRPGRRRRVRAAAAADRRAGEGALPRLAGQAADGGGRRPGRAAARATSSACRRDGGRGWPSSSIPGSPISPTRGRWCSPRTSGPAGWARSTSRARSAALARVRVPKNFNHRSPHARRDLAATLRNARVENDLGARRIKHRSAAADDPVLDDLRRALRAHPCTTCPTGRSACGWPSGGCARCARPTRCSTRWPSGPGP